jgi:hypothetical protein
MSWIDYVDTAHLISQTASANQCAMPLATALFANAKCAYFSGVQLYDSNRAPSLFSFGHDGSGSAISAAFSVDTTSPNHVCLCTGQSGVSNVNSFQFGTVVGQTYYQVFKTAASANIVLNVAGSIGANQPTYMTGMFTSPNWSLRQRSTVINTGGQSVTPDPGSPASTLRVGAGGVSVGNVWVGNIRSFYLLRRTLSAAELAVMQAWYLKDTGIPLT